MTQQTMPAVRLTVLGFGGPFANQVRDLDDRGYSVQQIARHLQVSETAVDAVLIHRLWAGASR